MQSFTLFMAWLAYWVFMPVSVLITALMWVRLTKKRRLIEREAHKRG